MVQIPTNKVDNTQKDALIARVLERLKTENTFSSYYWTDRIPRSLADEVCSEFVNHGYHAKMVFFCDGRASYQRFDISKNHLSETRSMMTYSCAY